LSKLNEHNVAVKILTGDNDIVTTTICKQVGLPVEHILLGNQIEEMNEAQLGRSRRS
jgi:Mg2+-importing ATPase